MICRHVVLGRPMIRGWLAAVSFRRRPDRTAAPAAVSAVLESLPGVDHSVVGASEDACLRRAKQFFNIFTQRINILFRKPSVS